MTAVLSPADRAERWPLARLTAYARNARTHSPAQIAQIAASMQEWGWTNPILVDEAGGVIAGHGRLLAARSLGLADAPVLVATGWSEAQKRAYVIADNKLALNAGWDEALLRTELEALRADGMDLGLVGFSADDLLELFGVVKPGPDPDVAPDPPSVPVSVLGDVWIMGPHRLAVGDACDHGVFERLLDGLQADVVWTDPPYNVTYEGHVGSVREEIRNDSLSGAAYDLLLMSAFANMWTAMKAGSALYVAHADTQGLAVRKGFLGAGFKLAGCLVWRKDTMVMGRSDYQWQHEPILYGWKLGASHRWFGGRKQTTIAEYGDGSPFKQRSDGRWEVTVGEQTLVITGEAEVEELVGSVLREARPRVSEAHPTMKPTALIERMLRNSARPGDLVLDPFGGSGSTLIAAERLGMQARLVELDPRYADVIVKRWQDYSGRKATLAADGRAFGVAA